jgi:organic hydroperoxide reductase OsmC/OhrA
VHGYEDEATSRLELSGPAPRLGVIRIAATVRVAAGTDPEVVRALADRAHQECYVANSLSVPVEVSTTVVTV